MKCTFGCEIHFDDRVLNVFQALVQRLTQVYLISKDMLFTNPGLHEGQKLNDVLQNLFIRCLCVCVCVPVCMCAHEYVVNTEILEKKRSKFTTVQTQASCTWVYSRLASQWFLSKLELGRRADTGLLKSLFQER